MKNTLKMKKTHLIIVLFSLITFHGFSKVIPSAAFQVKVSGKGQPMLFIPGATCSGEEWQASAAYFSQKYQCHVFTLAGYAGIPPLANSPYLNTFKSELIKYITDNKLKNVIIVGHSIGGFLALKIASEMTRDLEKVVIIDAMPFYAGALNPAAKIGFNEQQAKIMLTSLEKMNNNQLKSYQLAIAKTLCADSSKWDMIAGWGSSSDRKTVAYTVNEMMGEDIRLEIAKIKVPVLVMAAYKSVPEYIGFTKEYVEDTFKQQYKRCTTCTIIISPPAKHFIMYDAPDWFVSEIDAFIHKN